MKSTSLHSLNSDRRLDRPRQVLWFGLNWLNNHFFPHASASRLQRRDFIADTSDAYWQQVVPGTTPSRRLCDLFWMQLPWEAMQSELGDLHIFDTGCGTGDYGLKLQAWSSDRLASYTGVDLFPNPAWPSLAESHPNFKFFQAGSDDILARIPSNANLFISQSAIEHFESDLRYFENLRAFIRQASRPVIQVHLFPSAACLRLYLFHGVRQYTPHTVTRITDLFDAGTSAWLFRLGGRECNRLHWRSITVPRLRKRAELRISHPDDYELRLREAISRDNQRPSSPSFYALVIHSNPRQPLFN
jgi:hypothetical protein